MNPWKNQTDAINGFDFIRKIEGSVLYEQVCIQLRVVRVKFILADPFFGS